MKKSKQIIASVMALVLVTAIAVGGTLAYLSATASEDNPFTFTSGSDINIRIDEGNWDPDNAKSLLPGQTIVKEPQVFNTSTSNVDIWTAVKVSYVKGTDILTDADEYYTKNIKPYVSWENVNTVNFEQEAVTGQAATIFYYKSKLDNPNGTEKLFSAVKIASDMPNPVAEALNKGGGFIIRVEAAAIQAESLGTINDAKAELKKLFK